MSPLPLFLLLLLVLALISASASASARGLGGGDRPNPPDAAVDLNSSTFASALSAAPARFAVVEFFAHWCPACRTYKPQYERVARIFNGPNAVHPGHVIMARVDCALKMNTELCNRFSVNRYPMLVWGQTKMFVSGHWKPGEGNSEIQSIDDGRTAEHLLNWINKQLGRSFTLEDQKFANENTLQYNLADPQEISQAIYDVEEATAYAFDIILSHKMIKAETHYLVIELLQLLTTHHPSKRCRRGSAEILVDFSDVWPLDSRSFISSGLHDDHKINTLKNYQICGKELPRGYWIFCRGSRNDTRGFSCGLWVLFHSLSVRVGDGESHSVFTTIRDYVHNFFICDDCRQHFYDMCSQVTTPFTSSRALTLWLWSTHNKVNERLRKEEITSVTGDLKFPKMMWPPKQLCPTCFSSSNGNHSNFTYNDNDWNKDEVYKFLVKYYGQLLVSSFNNDELGVSGGGHGRSVTNVDDDGTPATTNAVAVPVGAALGIALACCTFGALAWFWRAQQKNRKQYKKVELQ